MKALKLPNRAALAISGNDATGFLQGLITNDILGCAEDQAIYAALLTPQGKYLFDFFIYFDGARYLFDVEARRKGDLIQKLTFYRLRAEVEIAELSGQLDIWAFTGDPALGAAPTYPDPRASEMGWRGFLESGTGGKETWTFRDYEDLRLALGLADGSRDIEVDKRFILEANFTELNGVDFDKGCYIGQEMTARMTYRGSLKKRLMPVTTAGALPAPGDALLAGGKDAGHFCSGQGGRAIALVRLEYLDKDLTTGEGAKVSVETPKWLKQTLRY